MLITTISANVIIISIFYVSFIVALVFGSMYSMTILIGIISPNLILLMTVSFLNLKANELFSNSKVSLNVVTFSV